MLIGENQKEPENAKAGYCAHGGQSICTLESQPRRIGILRMTDFQDLQTRVGQVEQAICELDDEHRDLLNGLQNGLNIAREKLIRKKFEIDRLTEENKKRFLTRMYAWSGVKEDHPDSGRDSGCSSLRYGTRTLCG